jgi:hypothetical protein
MKYLLRSSAILALLLSAIMVLADNKSAKTSTSAAAKMSEPTRMMVIRGLNAELVFIRRPFPMGQKGLSIRDGKVSPSEQEVERMIAGFGPAVKPGDRAHITNIRFKGDNAIIFEINGGPKKKKKWYEHIEVGGAGGSVPLSDPSADPNANPRGSFVELQFAKYVPEMSIEQIKTLLNPVFDFHAKSAAEAYMDTLPPKLKDAIKQHEVLVGMNREMVTYAMGRPPKKHREHDGDTEYEEWIYGEPPKDVHFVRFVGDEVVRLEIMKVGGEKVIRTEREIDMKPTLAQKQEQQRQKDEASKPMKAPTLRRPGEPPLDGSDLSDSPPPRDPKSPPRKRPPDTAPPIPGNAPPL